MRFQGCLAGVKTFPNEENLFAHAHSLGQELFLSIKDKRVYEGQDGFREKFKLRMTGLVDMMKEHWPFEREYWSNKRRRSL